MRRATASADVSDALAAAAAVAAVNRQQQQQQRINFNLGVLHFTPSSEPFPLLTDAVEVRGLSLPGLHSLVSGVHTAAPCRTVQYNPSTIDINSDPAEMAYWIGILQVCPACSASARLLCFDKLSLFS